MAKTLASYYDDTFFHRCIFATLNNPILVIINSLLYYINLMVLTSAFVLCFAAFPTIFFLQAYGKQTRLKTVYTRIKVTLVTLFFYYIGAMSIANLLAFLLDHPSPCIKLINKKPLSLWCDGSVPEPFLVGTTVIGLCIIKSNSKMTDFKNKNENDNHFVVFLKRMFHYFYGNLPRIAGILFILIHAIVSLLYGYVSFVGLFAGLSFSFFFYFLFDCVPILASLSIVLLANIGNIVVAFLGENTIGTKMSPAVSQKGLSIDIIGLSVIATIHLLRLLKPRSWRRLLIRFREINATNDTVEKFGAAVGELDEEVPKASEFRDVLTKDTIAGLIGIGIFVITRVFESVSFNS